MIRRFQNALKTVKNWPKKFCPGTMLNEKFQIKKYGKFSESEDEKCHDINS